MQLLFCQFLSALKIENSNALQARKEWFYLPPMNNIKLDALVFAAHPDDAELSCSGTILSMVAEGKKVGIVDLTQGEMGTRGNPELRKKEAQKAKEVLGLSIRENLGLQDVFFSNTGGNQLVLIQTIRKYRPEIVFGNAIFDRHPDHGKASQLISDACFYAGLAKIETLEKGAIQAAWRPKIVYHYIQDRMMIPDLVMDITPFWDKKIESISCYSSQFFNPESKEPETWISKPDFVHFIEARAREMGHVVGVTFGEGFKTERPIKPKSIFDLQ